MGVTDFLNHWLQVKLLLEYDPDDLAARDTLQFFADALRADHGVDPESLSYSRDGQQYRVTYRLRQEPQATQEARFEAAEVELLVEAVRREPRYGFRPPAQY